MSKLKLKPDATFKHTVMIPVAGAEDCPVEFEFKHRSAEEMGVFWASLQDKQNIDAVMETVVGWDLDEPFNRENALLLLDNYPMSAPLILAGYQDEIFKARAGN